MALLKDAKQQVKVLEKDLRAQVDALHEGEARLRAEYDRAFKVGRTAATWSAWLGERVTQAAVAWVLGTVFVRFCEDTFNLPHLNARDAAADGMRDCFDFTQQPKAFPSI